MDAKELGFDRHELAMRHQCNASMLTNFRRKAALPLATVMAAFGPSWALTGATIVTESTDGLDGREAKKASEILGVPPSHEGSEDDHGADKEFHQKMLGGIAIHDLLRGHLASAAVVGANLGLTMLRDRKMAAVREQAHADGKDTKAILINKAKTGIQFTVDAVAVSPLASNRKGRQIRNSALSASTALSWIGYLQFKRQMKKSD